MTFTTANITLTLKSFSAEHKIPIEHIDFDIKAVYTSVRTTDEVGWTDLEADTRANVDELNWRSPSFQIKQNYEVELHPARPNEYARLDIVLSVDKYFTKVTATIKKESKLRYFDELSEYITAEINKRKAKNRILLHLYDEQMQKDIAKLTEKIKNGEELTEDFKISICTCPEFRPTINDKLIYHYLNKRDIDGKGPVAAIASPNTITAVSQNELLIEYIKPQEGIAGRDCKGAFLAVSPAQSSNAPTFQTKDGVKLVDEPDKKLYYSTKAGFVTLVDNVLDIKGEMAITEISMKKTGSIDVGSDKGAVLEITDSNPDSDAIGDNMKVKASEINVAGSIGAGAELTANSVKIGGQTHSTSKIFAKNAKIHKHKGYLESEYAKVELLEGGTIVANEVEIDDLVGGEVRSGIIRIKNLGRNSTLIASELIEIKNPNGEGNLLIIEGAAKKEDKEKLTEYNSKKHKCEIELTKQKKELETLMETIAHGREAALALKNKIVEEKTKNPDQAKIHIAQYKHYMELIERAKKKHEDLEELKEMIDNFNHEIDLLQFKIFEAKITAENVWKKFNIAKFRLLFPATELAYNLNENSKVKEISLRKINEGNYEIRTI